MKEKLSNGMTRTERMQELVKSRKAGHVWNFPHVTSHLGIPYGTESDRQCIDIYVPDGKGPFPVLVFVHGGGWFGGNRASTAISYVSWALPFGYAVASIDYRLTDEGCWPMQWNDLTAATEVTDDGKIALTTAGGNTATYCALADRIIVELNAYHHPGLKDLHDVYTPANPPHRAPIPLTHVQDRIGTTWLQVDPAKIVGIVNTNENDHIAPFKDSDPVTDKIGENVCNFLADELRAGRLPKEFLPIQSGVGNIANAVLAALGRNTEIPPFRMHTEVIQDSVIKLMDAGRCTFVGGCSLTVSDDCLKHIYENFDFYKNKIVLRPQEISNNPGIVRRLGLICMNTAIEVDLFGHVNSTHFYGRQMMNGIGGSGDFARNAYLTIFTCPSVAKKGAISSIVPMCSHIDHTEHDVDIVVTEQGVADLRGKSPRERAEELIEKCVHPEYKQLLRDYIARTPGYHTPCDVTKALEFHRAFLAEGDMRKANMA